LKRKISIPSKLAHLNDVERILQSYLQEECLYTSQAGYILLTVCESVNNAIIHGNKEDESKFVDIRIECNDDQLIIEVEDEGKGFNVCEVPDPTESHNLKNEHGRGIFLIKNLADQVEFRNNGSLVKIKFNLRREHQFLF
jgi:serine/threonine-protein kinase RsbW